MVLLRKNTGETVVSGRSRCFSCGKTISWYDNIPLISFLVLGGRCRWCHSKISWQYPIVEFLTGLLAAMLFGKVFVSSPQTTDLLFSFLFCFGAFASLFLIAAYDARTKIIDRGLLFVFSGFAIAAALLRWHEVGFALNVVVSDTVAAVLMWFFFWGLWYFSGETWMGRGDSSVVWWCAILVGFPLSLGALLASFWAGGLFGVFLLTIGQMRKFSKHKGRDILKMEIPFAPFLALGTFLAWYFSTVTQLLYQLLF